MSAVAMKFDGGKVQLSLLPRYPLEEIARVLMFGAQKYGRDNWRNGLSATRLVDALLRHVFAWLDGETHDPESGLHHLAHAGCNIVFLLWGSRYRPELDDRPLAPKPGLLPAKEAGTRVKELLDRYVKDASAIVAPIEREQAAAENEAFERLQKNGSDTTPLLMASEHGAPAGFDAFPNALKEVP